MTAGQDRIRLVVDITVDAVPIQGWISRVEDGWSRPFMGWIDLAGQLEAARGQTDPGAPQPHDPVPAQDAADPLPGSRTGPACGPEG